MRRIRKEFHFSDEDLKDLDYDVSIRYEAYRSKK